MEEATENGKAFCTCQWNEWEHSFRTLYIQLAPATRFGSFGRHKLRLHSYPHLGTLFYLMLAKSAETCCRWRMNSLLKVVFALTLITSTDRHYGMTMSKKQCVCTTHNTSASNYSSVIHFRPLTNCDSTLCQVELKMVRLNCIHFV